MKFQPDTLPGVNVLTRHEPGRVWIGPTPYAHSVLVPHRGDVLHWEATRFEDLTAAHFDALIALAPEVVLFGSGARLRFPQPAWLRGLIERRIGVETMDTAAACRTYNVLAAEGRSVAAALLVAPEPGG
ncbi:MAG: Mth938-like domain-containing protein [Burkholderiaceae bacterium]|nr:Mth938-like domain-containing protein [Burkholderiaceae bacterium]